MNNTPIIRTSLAFAGSADHTVEEAAADVIANLYGNAAFATPPVDEAALTALLTDFQNAMASQAQGGPAATADKNNKRFLLVAALKELAFYVQVTSDNDLAVLLSSGFHAVNRNRTPEPLATPVIVRLAEGTSSGSIRITVDPVRNARGYEVDFATFVDGTVGEWEGPLFYSGSRNMSVPGLTPGTMYAFKVRAMGGKTGKSEWSPLSTRMSL